MPVRFSCVYALAALLVVPLLGVPAEPKKGDSLPHFANKLDHAALFDCTARTIPDAPPRVWRISAFIYKDALGGMKVNFGENGLPNPFALPPNHGFKDYATDASIDEPTAGQLIRNAQAIVAKQTVFTKADGKVKVPNGSVKEFCELLDPDRPPVRADFDKAVARQFQTALKRQPTKDEFDRFAGLFEKNIADAGREEGVRTSLAAILLHPDALFRSERGAGTPDKDGLVMLTPRELAFAVAYALGDKWPDALLLAAAEKGQLNTPAQITSHVERLWNEPKFDKTRLTRFFREYFEYHTAADVFKDKKLNKDHDARVLVSDTDRLVQYILAQDQNVLLELLTTNKSFVAYAIDNKSKAVVESGATGGNKSAPRTAYNVTAWSDKQPMELPMEQRAGILTQPSWLVAHSTSFDNHAILRGKWVRERLLGNYVPDLPITVDAQLPDDPKLTLRERMKVTRDAYCWSCHEKMNDVGLPFEMFDHFGRFRTEEMGKPVDATGVVALTGDARVEGKVAGAVEMLHKLAKTDRVRQVFVRHAFRYWMGRNETAGDAWSLVQADKAYVASGGSMKALVVAIVTSDSFLYRRVK